MGVGLTWTSPYGIWGSHVMFTHEYQIPTLHLCMWCSHVICLISTCDVSMWSSLHDVGMWCWHMMLTCDVDTWCSHVNMSGVDMWISHVIITHDLARWSHAVPHMITCEHHWKFSFCQNTACDAHMWTFSHVMFTCEHFSRWDDRFLGFVFLLSRNAGHRSALIMCACVQSA